MTVTMKPCIPPAAVPFPPEIAELRIVPEGLPPFRLFTPVALDRRLFERFVGRGFMGKGNLTLRQRQAGRRRPIDSRPSPDISSGKGWRRRWLPPST